ncbi:MAG: carboxylating nicotinate-nucleotide diphosphorylase [Eubacteriaceae bacterium]|nr:carboxylating nicotinate-nucleotide diphosphorylase [Eubacteriaceae bacterium]
MMSFYETDNLIITALKEDMPNNDITTDSVVSEHSTCTVEVISKGSGILSGIGYFERVFSILGGVTVETLSKDGDAVSEKEILAILHGSTRSVLSGERTALNILQRMSGIATNTRKSVNLIYHTGCKILDTRKTTPNFRVFEKTAVLHGGGHNHRHNLSDGILIKDNHIMAAGSITKAVSMARENSSFVRRIEVETENLDMVREALEAEADIIMLDNMDLETMKKAVKMIGKKAITEASGNMTFNNILSVAETGVNYISMGSIIYSSGVLDISMKNLKLT